jgi:hypothetical protein
VDQANEIWFNTPSIVGDANRDGVFNSSDRIVVFQAGEYEDGIAGNSTWAEGDWSGDGDFDTTDLILAFQGGKYSPAAVVGSVFESAAPHESLIVKRRGLFSDINDESLNQRDRSGIRAGIAKPRRKTKVETAKPHRRLGAQSERRARSPFPVRLG